jgi:hypothetical protein
MSRPHHNLDAWKESMRLVHGVFALLERVAQLLGGLHRKVTAKSDA